jgi:hypothetical protein
MSCSSRGTALFLSSHVLYNLSLLVSSLCYYFLVFPSDVSAVLFLSARDRPNALSAAPATPLVSCQITSALLQCPLPSKQALRRGEEKLPATTARTGGARFPSRELRPLRGSESRGHGLIGQMCLRPWSSLYSLYSS